MRFLWLALAVLGCNSFGEAPKVRNRCLDDADCPSGVCDPDGLCVANTESDLEIALRVVPVEDAMNPTLSSWTSEGLLLGEVTEEIDFTLPAHVDVVGTVRWKEMRVPAEIVFTRPGLDGQAVERVRVSTLPEPTTRGTMEADFVARLEAGSTYDVEVRPSAETIPGSDLPWLRVLPPLRLQRVETPPPEEGAEIVWPVAILFPPLATPCGPGVSAGCSLAGTIVGPDAASAAGLQVRAVEVETGAVVSSTALTDEGGAFQIAIAPDAGPYLLRVSGGEERPLFPTVSVDPSLLPGEARIRVPTPTTVRYQGRVEGADGTPLTAATLTFESFDVFDETVMLGGSYRTSTRTGSRGEFDVELLAGTYQIVVSPSAGQFSVLTEELRIAAPATGGPVSGQLFVVPERARVGATVETEEGEPLAEVSVEAVALGVQAEGAPIAARFNRSSDAMSGLEGDLELRLDLGTYDLFLKPPAESGYGWMVLPGYEVRSLDAAAELSFVARAPIPVRGTVRSDEGVPLPGADIRVFGRAVGTERFVELGRGRADDEGRFRVLVAPQLADGNR